MLFAEGAMTHARERLGHPDQHARRASAPTIEPSPPTITMTNASRVYDGPSAGVTSMSGTMRAAGHRDAGGAEPEGHGVEVRDGQARDARAERIVGAGADRLAGEREAKERGQQRRRHQRRARRVDARLVDQQRPELERVELVARSARCARRDRSRATARSPG